MEAAEHTVDFTEFPGSLKYFLPGFRQPIPGFDLLYFFFILSAYYNWQWYLSGNGVDLPEPDVENRDSLLYDLNVDGHTCDCGTAGIYLPGGNTGMDTSDRCGDDHLRWCGDLFQ